MKISYHGHAVVQIEANGKKVIIDPFITGNSLTDLKVEDIKVDAVLLTHGHNDHFGDTIDIAKANDALVVGAAEIAGYVGQFDVKGHGMNIGGANAFDFGKVKYTQALHSSSYTNDKGEIIYLGNPMGIIFEAEGVTVYHAGDTALFSDMKLIGDRHDIDVAFLPIGDNFTMGPEDAAYAVSLLKPKIVVPIHFDTFPPIKQNPQQFADLVKDADVQVLQPGQEVQLVK